MATSWTVSPGDLGDFESSMFNPNFASLRFRLSIMLNLNRIWISIVICQVFDDEQLNTVAVELDETLAKHHGYCQGC